MDEKLKPYAGFLESMAKCCVERQPKKIVVCALLPNDSVMTAYCGEVKPSDMAAMAHYISCDAIMQAVYRDSKKIVQAAELEGDLDGN